jgi:D-glycerate 3-kinase
VRGVPFKHKPKPDAIPLQGIFPRGSADAMATAPEPTTLAALIALTERTLTRRAGMVVLGLSGAQGSGKSTLAAALHAHFAAQGLVTATLSLDDLYHTRSTRLRLAAQIHPLLITRGVPGTHDIALGLATIDALARGEAALLPRFDKARDDRRPPTAMDRAPVGTRLLLFEGWCLGARAQTAADLATPINALEAHEDADGVWRNHVNIALAGDYAALWRRIDALAMLRAPGFDAIAQWRQQQELALRQVAGMAPGVMDDTALRRFVAHYERITRQLLHDLPDRADLVIELDRNRTPTRIVWRR